MELDLGSSASAWFRFAVAALAVWRVAHLLAREGGPWALVARLEEHITEPLIIESEKEDELLWSETD